MARKTEKYDPLNPGVPTASPQYNWAQGSNIWVDANGNVIRADEFTGRTRYQLGQMPCGVNTISGRFTGNPIYRETDLKSVTVHNGDCLSGVGGVQQLVAGPGIYLSAANGLGRVTVSTRPLNANYQKVSYFCVTWPVSVEDVSGYPLKFFVGGNQGANVSSVDGFNWSTAEPNTIGADIGAIMAVADPSIPDYHVEVTGAAVNIFEDETDSPVPGGAVVYGRLGWAGTASSGAFIDSVSDIQQVTSPSVFFDEMTAIPTASGILYLSAVLYTTTTTNTVTNTVVNTTNATILRGRPNNRGGAASFSTESTLNDITITGFAHNGSKDIDNPTVLVCGGIYPPYPEMPTTGRGIYRSDRNGITAGTGWTQVINTPTDLNGIAYGEGKWVAVSDNNIMYVSTDTVNWTAVNGPLSGTSWGAITYGNGKFVAVGGALVNGQTIGAVGVSEDGVNWTKGSAPANATLYDVAYSPQLNVFVAVGDNATIVAVEG